MELVCPTRKTYALFDCVGSLFSDLSSKSVKKARGKSKLMCGILLPVPRFPGK